MVDLSIHTFTTNDKGFNWLAFVTVACIVLAVILVIGIVSASFDSAEVLISTISLVGITIYTGFALYCDWRSLSYAMDTSLSIDMKTFTFTYRHNGKSITFKGLDVEHWYWDTGLYLSRVSANHTVIVLKTGETLYIHCWLFEGNHFFLSNYDRYNANHFMKTHCSELLLPAAENAHGYHYLLPPEE